MSKCLKIDYISNYKKNYKIDKFVNEKQDECLICYCKYHADDQVLRCPNCHKKFHKTCLDMWFRIGTGSSSCPHCRSVCWTGYINQSLRTPQDVHQYQNIMVLP